MKRTTLLLAGVLCTFGLDAQLFTDGFEAADGYSVGDYIGPGPNTTNWTTWSGTEGGAEDAQVTSAQANTGSNSIYFASTAANGGPQDVILDFGQAYTSGTFTFEAAFFVEAGKNAYFNFQATPTAGTQWAMNCNMDGGAITIDDGLTANLATGTYTDDTWFTLNITADLGLGRWVATVDGNCIGVWQNGVNSVASVDFFPLNNGGYYVDDVMFDHATTSYNLNAAVIGVVPGGRNIAGENVNPTVTVGNAGSTTITSFDLTIDYNGNQYNENVTGQSLAAGATVTIPFTTPVPLVDGNIDFVATVSNVNGGGQDENAGDDATCGTKAFAVTPAPGKIVVGEEGTGTWCPWCVRGTVFMDRFETDYGSDLWAGIAVHNGDPMTVDTYDQGLGTMIGGYPSAVVDRGADVDPSGMLNPFLERIVVAPAAQMKNGANWDATSRTLEVSVTAIFDQAATDQYKMLLVLTEDGVTGTGSGWEQANAYAGGSNGPMGGYENLPSPVPAAQMVYDHVARAITPSFAGTNTCFPATISAGDSVTNNYSFTLPADWDDSKIHIIGMLVDPTGRIDNASKSDIATAVSNGFVGSCNLSVVDLSGDQIDDILRVYPNPASTHATIEINISQESDVQLRIVDMAGKQIAARDYGTIATASKLELNTADLETGVYLVEMTVNGEKVTKRLAIK